jgi:hypothetical protein
MSGIFGECFSRMRVLRRSRQGLVWVAIIGINSIIWVDPAIGAPTPDKPEWTVPSTIESDDGHGVLVWEVGEGQGVDIFLLQEKSENDTSESFPVEP